ncbi:hypothetical protein LIER_43112 [Lithospermum erythrorhizon]|uniref:Uncharacterized protein n=1 Tax=Lithospermum erythrorhizon TaxID=34254 RepID=A0AAV3PID3_LITER
MNKKKAGRTKHLRMVNPIEAEDNGKTKHCKVRTYLCKVCRESGHNSRACKKTREHNVRKSEPIEDEPVHYEPVQDEPIYNATQESRANAPRQPLRPLTSGISIRAPPPMFGSVYGIPFKPPPRAAMRPPTVFFNQGRIFLRRSEKADTRKVIPKRRHNNNNEGGAGPSTPPPTPSDGGGCDWLANWWWR